MVKQKVIFDSENLTGSLYLSDMSFVKVIAKNGAEYYYSVDANGKKTRVAKDKAKVAAKADAPKVVAPKKKIAAVKKTVAKKTAAKVAPKKIPEKKLVAAKITKKKTTIPKPLAKTPPAHIRIGQTRRAHAHPSYPGYEHISAWSRGKAPWKDLSPFTIGPVNFVNDEGEEDSSLIFENFWQSFKVWDRVAKQNQIVKKTKEKTWVWPAESHIGADGNPNGLWEKWHNSLLHNEYPVRRPNGKAVPKYAWWRGKKLDIVAARREIYVPYLKELYRAHPTYQKLLAKFRAGTNLMIVEPDGALLEAYPQGMEISLEKLEELVGKTNYADEGYPERYRPFGHGFVIAMCLLEDTT